MEIISLLVQLPVLLCIALAIAIPLNAVIELWRDDHGRVFKIVWTIVIMSIPLCGAYLYYILVSKAWREIIS